MKTLCIIPARGGSKGVPGKNLAVVAGESLTARAARCAQESGAFDRIIVSTDDPAIAEEAVKGGAEAPFLRPPELASDGAAVIDAVRHTWEAMASSGFEADYIALLEPTSPLRTPDIVRTCMERVIGLNADSGQTISPVPDNYRPMKQMYLHDDGHTGEVMPMPEGVVRRQDLPMTYIRNGMVYVMSRHSVMDLGAIIGPNNVGIAIDGPAINIDWPEDLDEARRLIETGAASPAALPLGMGT